jgi:hypothetical protein
MKGNINNKKYLILGFIHFSVRSCDNNIHPYFNGKTWPDAFIRAT